MDKSDRALGLAEDLSAAVDAIEKRLPTAVGGRRGDGITSFGKINARNGGVALILFDGAPTEVKFCGAVVAQSGSPVFASLNAGRGELCLSDERDNARALVFSVK